MMPASGTSPALRGAPEKRLNLIFVHQPTRLSHVDLEVIAGKIIRLAPEIKVHGVLPTDGPEALARQEWTRPTLTVSFGPVRRFVPLRGPIYENKAVPKLAQFRAFRAQGIATPHTAAFLPGMELDPAVWGPFVILKPSNTAQTSNGLHLQVFRTQSLSRRSLPGDHPARRIPMLVQQWIDTGERLTSYRCLTLFGASLYGSKSQSLDPHPPLDSPDEVIETMQAESDRGQNKMCTETKYMDFAARMAKAFPRHPILGCDILEEEGTGTLYAIEVNAGGNVWHFSSPRTAPWRSVDGTERLKRAFSSFDVAAEVLVKLTRAEAR